MKNFYVLLQKLIDTEAKPNSILCFCRDLYEYKHAKWRYDNAPTKAMQRARYDDYARHHANVKDWLRTFNLDDIYEPDNIIGD